MNPEPRCRWECGRCQGGYIAATSAATSARTAGLSRSASLRHPLEWTRAVERPGHHGCWWTSPGPVLAAAAPGGKASGRYGARSLADADDGWDALTRLPALVQCQRKHMRAALLALLTARAAAAVAGETEPTALEGELRTRRRLEPLPLPPRPLLLLRVAPLMLPRASAGSGRTLFDRARFAAAGYVLATGG